jgi:hypothetical protein
MRSLVSDLSRHNPTPVARALHWALPWSRRGYPGFHRGVTEIIEHWVTPTAVQHWRRGRRRMQIRDAVRLQQYVASRVAEGQEILAGARGLHCHEVAGTKAAARLRGAGGRSGPAGAMGVAWLMPAFARGARQFGFGGSVNRDVGIARPEPAARMDLEADAARDSPQALWRSRSRSTRCH